MIGQVLVYLYLKINDMDKLTEEDLNNLQYFWQEKEDLERFSSFEELKPLLEKEKPEVLKAWNDYKTSRKILDIVIDNLLY